MKYTNTHTHTTEINLYLLPRLFYQCYPKCAFFFFFFELLPKFVPPQKLYYIQTDCLLYLFPTCFFLFLFFFGFFSGSVVINIQTIFPIVIMVDWVNIWYFGLFQILLNGFDSPGLLYNVHYLLVWECGGAKNWTIFNLTWRPNTHI